MRLRRVVAVSRDADIQQLAQHIGQEVFLADDPAEVLDIVDTVNADLVILDSRCGPAQTREFIGTMNIKLPKIPIVVVGSAENEFELSGEPSQLGRCAYLSSREDFGKLEQIISRLNDKSDAPERETRWNHFFANDFARTISMVGNSKAVQETLKMIKIVAASRCNPVLVLGETGTGKELVAKGIHLLRHAGEQFVAVNCAALTASLLESELFGHVKGSFTGADREKAGLLELAGSGTVFLDEISEMPLELQAKLLRVLQDKTFRKVGGVTDIACTATIIASSNRNLKQEVQANQFRRDLYYRLNICPITVAPLRSGHRKEDISLLAEHFLLTSTICPEKVNKISGLTKLAIEALQKHDWLGNVRELRNVIEKAILLETTDKIGLNSIVFDPIDYSEQPENLDSELNCSVKDFSLAKAERELIGRALQETGWQKTQAASLLGITRATLYAKVKQYNIERDSLPAAARALSTLPSPQPVTAAP